MSIVALLLTSPTSAVPFAVEGEVHRVARTSTSLWAVTDDEAVAFDAAGEERHRFSVCNDVTAAPTRLQVAADEHAIAVVCESLRVHEVPGGKELWRREDVASVAFGSDGRIVTVTPGFVQDFRHPRVHDRRGSVRVEWTDFAMQTAAAFAGEPDGYVLSVIRRDWYAPHLRKNPLPFADGAVDRFELVGVDAELAQRWSVEVLGGSGFVLGSQICNRERVGISCYERASGLEARVWRHPAAGEGSTKFAWWSEPDGTLLIDVRGDEPGCVRWGVDGAATALPECPSAPEGGRLVRWQDQWLVYGGEDGLRVVD